MSGKKKDAPRIVQLDSKGYLQIRAGPQRGQRVHTLIAEAMLGRKLKPDEQVHHRDGNKLNNDWRNLQVLDIRDHGAVSSRQRWYFKEHDIKLKKDWDEFFEGENQPTEGGLKELADRELLRGNDQELQQEEKGDVSFP